MWVKWVYFYSEVELAVVWHEAGKHTQLIKEEKQWVDGEMKHCISYQTKTLDPKAEK